MTSSRAALDRLQDVLRQRQYEIPEEMGFEGTGAPGLYLEHLLGLRTSNVDIPDAGEWEIKFSSGSSLVTLFHKAPYHRGAAVRYMINRWGWTGSNGRPSFRHTICGQSDRFTVVDEANEIRVRRIDHDDFVPHWPHDVLVNALSRKLRHLILVHGRKRGRTVWYESAETFREVRSTGLSRALVNGRICIDFDAFIQASGTVRNHGTKFRIKPDDIGELYARRERVQVS
mgnify:FL=1